MKLINLPVWLVVPRVDIRTLPSAYHSSGEKFHFTADYKNDNRERAAKIKKRE